jgi:hypothetical protein
VSFGVDKGETLGVLFRIINIKKNNLNFKNKSKVKILIKKIIQKLKKNFVCVHPSKNSFFKGSEKIDTVNKLK